MHRHLNTAFLYIEEFSSHFIHTDIYFAVDFGDDGGSDLVLTYLESPTKFLYSMGKIFLGYKQILLQKLYMVISVSLSIIS